MSTAPFPSPLAAVLALAAALAPAAAAAQCAGESHPASCAEGLIRDAATGQCVPKPIS